MSNLKNDLTIVMYHYVRQLPYTRYPRIKALLASQFRYQVNYLSQNYNIVRMEQVIEAINGGTNLPDKACLLTFDDGYLDHFTEVFPFLDSLNIQGSFFPPGRAIAERKLLDVNKIQFTLASANENHLLHMLKMLVEKYRAAYSLLSFEEYASALDHHTCRYDSKDVVLIKRLLQYELPEPARLKIVDDLFREFVGVYDHTLANELYMNESQLKCMIRAGMHIGSHGWDHFWLDKLDAPTQISEIDRSLNFLSGLGAKSIDWTMCYPYGAFNEDTISYLEQTGCSLGLTTNVEVANIAMHHRFKLPRLDTNDFPKE